MATYTNFCILAGGSNLNAGTRTGNTTVPGTSADFTYASGSWVQATRVFTVASGNPASDGVAVGDFASVYADGSTTTGFIGRVTARDATTITISATASSGTAPTDGTNTRTLKIGGGWSGPSGASDFPIDTLTAACTNAAGDPVRLNASGTNTISATMTHATGGCVNIRGFTSAYDDGGRWVIDGGTSGAAYTLLSSTSGTLSEGTLVDIEFKNNGATGGSTSIHGLNLSGVQATLIRRCVFRDMRSSGLAMVVSVSPTGNRVEECEFYGLNQGNIASCGAIRITGGCHVIADCIIHDNTGSNTSGIILSSGVAHVERTVFDTNGGIGFNVGSNTGATCDGCEFYNNTSHGINTTVAFVAKNCNFLLNAGTAVNNPVTSITTLINCGFGTGTQANGVDIANTGSCEQIGTVTYAANVTPWVDPGDGNFSITLAAAKNTGRGTFLQTQSGYGDPSPTLGYPDIGAAQHNDVASGSPIAARAVMVASIGTY